MTLDEFKNQLLKAYESQTLLTDKHDPNKMETTHPVFRTVVSYDVAKKLFQFIDTGIEKVISYKNSRFPDSPTYMEIVPKKEFDVAASGIISYDSIPTSALDRIVAVFGRDKGWHIFGEDSNRINKFFSYGELTDRKELK